jgi:hypothetical protein
LSELFYRMSRSTPQSAPEPGSLFTGNKIIIEMVVIVRIWRDLDVSEVNHKQER